MNDVALVNLGTGELTRFDPSVAKVQDKKLDALARYASEIKDLEMLERVIEAKITLQRKFVADWDARVQPQGGADRTGDNRPSAIIGSTDVATLEGVSGIKDHQVCRWRKRISDPDSYKLKLAGKFSKDLLALLAGNMMSETSEWYTPAEYIESVKAVFGGEIDLDPASCATANVTVGAVEFFTEKDRGDTRDWHGRVFLNPPYGLDKRESRAGKFCLKAIAEFQARRVSECIILVNSVHAQNWQRPLYDFPICFVDHRIAFADAEGEINPNPTFMNMFVYLGPHKKVFAREFAKHGYVLERVQW
jgi:hypothetical protein